MTLVHLIKIFTFPNRKRQPPNNSILLHLLYARNQYSLAYIVPDTAEFSFHIFGPIKVQVTTPSESCVFASTAIRLMGQTKQV